MAQLVVYEFADLKNALKAAMSELNEESTKLKQSDKLYTINEVRKRLGKAHATIKRAINAGYIKTTKDGLISEAALNDYLQKS